MMASGIIIGDPPRVAQISPEGMVWVKSNAHDPRMTKLADRHYSRKTIGSNQMMPPGRRVVLTTDEGEAGWGVSWPYAHLVAHAWPEAWCCTFFRNESPYLSSDLVNQAVAVTRFFWPDVPDEGIITFINPKKVRHKRDQGRCYRKAGWHEAGYTKGGHLVLRQYRDEMPPPAPPRRWAQQSPMEL